MTLLFGLLASTLIGGGLWLLNRSGPLSRGGLFSGRAAGPPPALH